MNGQEYRKTNMGEDGEKQNSTGKCNIIKIDAEIEVKCTLSGKDMVIKMEDNQVCTEKIKNIYQ